MTSPGRYPLRSRTSSAWRLFSMVCSRTVMRPRLPLRAVSRSFSFNSASAMRRLISACRRALLANSSSAAARCCASAVCASCASIRTRYIAPPALQRPSVRVQQASPGRRQADPSGIHHAQNAASPKKARNPGTVRPFSSLSVPEAMIADSLGKGANSLEPLGFELTPLPEGPQSNDDSGRPTIRDVYSLLMI